MVRAGKWELQVLCRGGERLAEHEIDSHWCVASRPQEPFTVKASYHGTGMYLVEILIDGKKVAARRGIDADRRTSRPTTSWEATGWEKAEAGSTTVQEFLFEKARESGDGEEEAGRPAGMMQWDKGVITLRVYAGRPLQITADTHGASHSADLRKVRP